MSRSAPPMRHSMESFVPSNGELIIRDNLAGGMGISTESHRKSGHLRRPATMGGYRFGKLSMSSFFTRHNPHPRRVNHFKGLLDVPICTVNYQDSAKKDYKLEFPPNGYASDLLALPTECINVNSSAYPMDTLTGLHYFHPVKKLPFGQQRNATPAASVTEPWRVEIQELAKAAGLTPRQEAPPKEERVRTSQYSAATGRLIPPPSKAMSRSGSRMKTAQFLNKVNTSSRDILDQSNIEDTVMMMLCQILQTEDVAAVQNWLGNAGDNEKGMVQELIKAAVTGKSEDYNSRFPVQEYVIGMDGLPMTPDIGTVIGEHVQNRLSTAGIADDEPAIPDPSMRPPSCTGPAVEEVVSRINQFSPRIPGKTSQLPPIPEKDTMAANAPVLESFLPAPTSAENSRPTSKPLPSITPKQESFNKALENITRKTLESLSDKENESKLKKYTVYPLKKDAATDASQTKTDNVHLRMSSASKREADLQQTTDSHPSQQATESEQKVWKPEDATVI